GVVHEIADRVMVFYAGRVVEEGPVAELFAAPRHPYTRGLLDSAPRPGRRERLRAIEGAVPNPLHLPPGCAFAPRCPLAEPACRECVPVLEETGAGRRAACRNWRKVA
ncbi:MAG: ABC transporter ATP-binding protein, partial [Alphaproteobacteria bacterium]